MSKEVVSYLLKNTKIKKAEAEKCAAQLFEYFDSLTKELGVGTLPEELKAKFTISSFEALKQYGKEIAERTGQKH